MEYFRDVLFFPVIVLIGIILVILNARLILRLALLFVALLAVWFGLYLLGVAPSPINYFREVRLPESWRAIMATIGHDEGDCFCDR